MVIRKNCDICSEELNNKSTMRRHSESHHRGKLGQCEDCGETRNKKRNNIAHIKENHYSYYTKLKVDEWAVKYEENPKTGELELIENFIGQTEIENVESQKYLGFVISSTGNNMMNINAVKKKAIGKVKLALNKLNSLHLKHYYFECAVIILNVVVRSSILYASEMYYELKGNELRQLERIEEQFMRKVLNTTKGCPITMLYLTLGHVPARFEIQKMRILYLKYILSQKEDSLVRSFFNLQVEMPTKSYSRLKRFENILYA